MLVFEITPNINSKMRLEIYSLTGQSLDVPFNDFVEKDFTYTITINTSNYFENVIIYRITTDAEVKTGKLMKIK